MPPRVPRVPGVLRRSVVIVAGLSLLLAGVVLLVLPGPGLLVILGGLVLLADQFAWARALVEPVRTRARESTRASVQTPWRIALTALTGLLLIAAGVTWAVVDGLPLSGWASGGGLVVSGAVLLGLLGYAHRQRRNAASDAR